MASDPLTPEITPSSTAWLDHVPPITGSAARSTTSPASPPSAVTRIDSLRRDAADEVGRPEDERAGQTDDNCEHGGQSTREDSTLAVMLWWPFCGDPWPECVAQAGARTPRAGRCPVHRRGRASAVADRLAG